MFNFPKDRRVKFATRKGLDNVAWLLAYEMVDDKTVRIVYHNAMTPFCRIIEDYAPDFRLVESLELKKIVSVRINDEVFMVFNPQHMLEYTIESSFDLMGMLVSAMDANWEMCFYGRNA